jgi:CubicO group peptidase (beta-lactamase class C family)
VHRNHVGALAVSILAVLATVTAAAAAAPIGVPSDAQIRKILANRVGENGVGIVVGIIGPHGRRIVSHGNVDGNTAFEIASVTKAFTALLLADMARRGEVALTDPVSKYLPDATIPARNGRSITLVDLATHTSGLPFMAEEGTATREQLYRFVSRYQLPRDVGADWEYSNIGYWLLSEALAARSGMSFERLLRMRVLQPLRLNDTAITLSPALKAKLAAGHDASLQPAPPWYAIPGYSMMEAAGGIVSTTNDLLSLLAVALGYQRTSLTPAMASMLETRRPTSASPAASRQALGWLMIGDPADPLIVHDGGTLGYGSSVAWDPKMGVGVVVLSNQLGDVGDIARHLLRPGIPLTGTKPVKHTEIVLDPAILDSYAGRYEAKGEGVFIIAREAGGLTIQSPGDWGLPKQHLRPESARDFFVSELPLRVTFQTNSRGVSGMVVYPPRGQAGVVATRIE